MREIIKYIVAGKEFNNKEVALNYEDNLRYNLFLRTLNLITYYWSSYSYPAHDKAVQLIRHFCKYHKYKESFVGELILNSPNFIKYLLDNEPNFTINKREQLLMQINKTYKQYQVNREVDLDLIDWEVEQMESEIKDNS